MDLFTETRNSIERKSQRDKAVLGTTGKIWSKCALRGINFMDGATQRERNEMIGGHRAGYDREERARQFMPFDAMKGLQGSAP